MKQKTFFALFVAWLMYSFSSMAKAETSVFIQDTESSRPIETTTFTNENKSYAGSTTFKSQIPATNYKAATKKGSLGAYKRNHFNLYSLNDDIKLGTQVQQEQIKEFKKKKIAVDPPEQAALKSRIEKIVAKLAKVSDRPNLPYEVHIYDKKDIVNAFCLPGGKIGIFTGLFDKEKGLVDPKSDDQIAAVLGHEMAHATLRHITRRLGTMQGLGIVGSIASVALGEGVGLDASKFFDQVYSFGVNLYLPNYSRKHEAEADRAGFYYMAKAGYNPQAAIDIWEQAASKGGRNSNKTDFFASHPADGERARTLKSWLPEALEISKGSK